MNMYLHELKSMRKSTIMWTCSMIAIALVYLSLYPAIFSDGAHFKDMLAGYPASIRAVLGVTLDSVTTLLGFYSMIIAFVVLCGGIQAMNLGMSMLSKETRERTADFLLVKPVSRAAVVTAKILAGLTVFLITDVVYYAGASVIASIVKQSSYSGGLFFMINLTLFFVQLIFFAIGAVVSVFFDRLRSVLPVSLGTVFGCYIIGALVAAGKDDWARFISPFRYFDYSYIIQNSRYETPYLATGAVIVIVSVVTCYFVYARKDIHAVS
ncbi:ABC transporter permease subunit [Candidatus Cryosericum terrychapinii]|uniref:ABC transporter permease n=1 Tax=Candidatus Cryosericum terrychapinii TaxID=2290919 RepID=A0A398CZT5_9BACT|nr:ABC transporter permease subunit [Candidatus Cryosericum terrychapinii]RIE06048.1 ABC transporter permease [Candidatus Cryosericum terrychapinii]